MRKRSLLLLLLGVIAIGLIGGAVALRSRGVRVTVTNRGPDALLAVTVYVREKAYSLGPLGPGESKEAWVRPSGKSHVELEIIDEDGQPRRLDAGGYFSGGETGTIEIELEDGTITRNEHHVEMRY
jgi:hypothetical protein